MPFGTSSTQKANKESDMLGQSISNPCNDFFQYLDFDTVEVAEGSNFAFVSQSPHVISSTSGSNSAGTSTSSMDVEARRIDLLLQPWLCETAEKQFAEESLFDQLPAETSIYSEQSGRAAISDSELLSLEGISLSSSKLPSLPSSPTQSATKSARRRDRILSSVSKTFKRRNRGSQDTLRASAQKSHESSKMMSPSRYSQEWDQHVALDAHKFDFGFPQPELPLSPPPSARVSDASSNGTAIMFKAEAQANGFYNPHHFSNGITDYTPLTTPIAPDGFAEMPGLQGSVDYQYPSTPLQPPWEQVSNNGQYTYRDSPSFVSDTEANPVWMNHATTKVVHPSPSAYHSDARHASKTLAMQLQNSLKYNDSNLSCNSSSMSSGLMIQMPESPNQQSYITDSSPRSQQGFFMPPQQPKHSNPYNSTSHQRSPRHRRNHNGSSSPPNIHSPKSRSHSHSQTLKASTAKGIRDNSNYTTKRGSRTPSRKSSSNNISSQRNQSLQSPVVDFVNFTPSDSMRILTGVAPSGSSKTKARREKEANEKRRRLSMAAMRAVRAAGGDVESLVEEGLFV